MRPATLSMIVAVSSAAVVPCPSASAQALPKLSRELAGKSVQCGAGSSMYFDPGLRTALIVDGTAGLFPIAESRTTIEPSRIRSDDAQRFDVVLTTREGETRFTFERRDGISLRLDGSAVGDSCALSSGRAGYLQNRFDMIREGVCGNDPRPSCEAGLAASCGPYPEAACVRRYAPGRR